MFHRVTAIVYGGFGAMAGYLLALMLGVGFHVNPIICMIIGTLLSLGTYYTLRFLRFAEAAYNREMLGAPRVFTMKKSSEHKK